jgi:hypothetical protein
MHAWLLLTMLTLCAIVAAQCLCGMCSRHQQPRHWVRTSAAGGRSAGRCARQDSTSALSSGAQFPGIGLRYPYATLQHSTHM